MLERYVVLVSFGCGLAFRLENSSALCFPAVGYGNLYMNGWGQRGSTLISHFTTKTLGERLAPQ